MLTALCHIRGESSSCGADPIRVPNFNEQADRHEKSETDEKSLFLSQLKISHSPPLQLAAQHTVVVLFIVTAATITVVYDYVPSASSRISSSHIFLKSWVLPRYERKEKNEQRISYSWYPTSSSRVCVCFDSSSTPPTPTLICLNLNPSILSHTHNVGNHCSRRRQNLSKARR